jgi:glycosyltransferase involved in cell wall biosynthesis
MTRGLRVAVVARSVAPLHGLGGLERSVFDLVRYLAAHEVEVTLVTRPPDRRGPAHGAPGTAVPGIHAIDPRIVPVYVPYRTFPLAGRRGTTVLDRSTAYPVFGLNAGWTVLRLVRAGRIDLVHGFGASVLGYARNRRGAGAPLVLNPQGMEEFGATDPSRARLKRAAYLPLRRAVAACAAAADRVIATDRALEPAVRAHLRVPPERVRVIPNALDLPALDRLAAPGAAQAVRRRAGISQDAAVLLSVGRVERSKGFHVLVSALAALHGHGGALRGAWRWVLVGDGPYRPHLERAVRAAGLQRHVLLAGRTDDADLHAWYEAATLFVHPTLYEGSSLVTLEAMAHRRAVVGTAAGGIPDKVRPGVNGWLVPPGDAAALAAAISGALGGAERLAAMGAAGRAIVEEEFSWAAAGAATLAMYEELVARAPRAPAINNPAEKL